jgi:GNAT superfamily N-acetyltransferase
MSHPRIMIECNQHDVDRYWAVEMAMPLDFRPMEQGVYCTVQQRNSGVQLFLRNDWLVIAAPAHRVEQIAAGVCGLPISEVFCVEFVARLLFPDMGKILGPAHVSYADASMFRPSLTDGCRLLTPDDAAIRQDLAAALSAAELEQSGFNAQDAPAFGAFADGVLCAVASYKIWEPKIAHITVATHPDHRRRGHGRAAVSALAEHALARGFVLQHRALAVNESSLALGCSMGFEHYASTIYARLEKV